jgi:hypothetical protein
MTPKSIVDNRIETLISRVAAAVNMVTAGMGATLIYTLHLPYELALLLAAPLLVHAIGSMMEYEKESASSPTSYLINRTTFGGWLASKSVKPNLQNNPVFTHTVVIEYLQDMRKKQIIFVERSTHKYQNEDAINQNPAVMALNQAITLLQSGVPIREVLDEHTARRVAEAELDSALDFAEMTARFNAQNIQAENEVMRVGTQ